MHDLDYTRYGRQIALTEVGATGQRRLALEGVRFAAAFGAEAVAARAAQLYQRAGGGLDERSEIVLRVPNARTVAGRLAVAAFHAVEAGRRALGEPPCELPDELLAHVEALGGEP